MNPPTTRPAVTHHVAITSYSMSPSSTRTLLVFGHGVVELARPFSFPINSVCTCVRFVCICVRLTGDFHFHGTLQSKVIPAISQIMMYCRSDVVAQSLMCPFPLLEIFRTCMESCKYY